MQGSVEPQGRAEYERAVSPHLSELFGTAVRLTRSQSDAEDLLQETMMRAWAFWDRFQTGTNARAWMHRILVNTFINGYRRRRREREILEQVQKEVARRPFWLHQDAEAERTGLGDEVTAALSAIPADFREAVLLVDLQGLSYREAADLLGCPIGTVMSRLHRGRKRLHKRLRDYALAEGYLPEAGLEGTAQAA